MKKIIYFILFTVFFIFGAGTVRASDNDAVLVKDESSLEECLKEDGVCKLDQNLDISSRKVITGNVVLDLSGHSIEPEDDLRLTSGLVQIKRGGKLTLVDSKGSGKISTTASGKVWAAIQLPIDDGSADYAELEVNGGTIEGYYYAITGNGTVHNTKITINGGTIKALNTEDSVGIYQPQYGEVTINGGSISGGTGIEMRSGILRVNNGNITGVAPSFVKTANKNGSTTNGVGVAVAQHTTKNTIDIYINGGDIKGQYAFYEWNPHNNSTEDLKKVKLHIDGGEFTSLSDNKAVYSQDFTNFVSGGKFSPSLTEYLTDDADVVSKSIVESKTEIREEQSKKKGNLIIKVVLVILALGIVVLSGLFIYKKRLL